MSVSSEPKAKEIDDEVSETSDSGVAAPTRHVKMRARQDNGLRTLSWTPGALGVGRGEGLSPLEMYGGNRYVLIARPGS